MHAMSLVQVVVAVRQLQRSGDVRDVLVKLGSRGSMYVSNDPLQPPLLQACFSVPPEKVVDTTGAGMYSKGD